MKPVFQVRHQIARLGENDWMRWWDSNALTDAGRYTLPRLFRRTPAWAGAHLAILAARVRHDAAVPREPLVHLFYFGEALEGAFERWLIERKAEGEELEEFPQPNEEMRRSVRAALERLGISPSDTPAGEGATRVLGSVRAEELGNERGRSRIAQRLAAAYTASDPGQLVVPYFRLEG